MKKYLMTLLVVVCLFTLTACGSSNKLVGTWEGATGDGLKTTFEFKKDGKVEYSNEFGIKSSGTYEIKENVVTISLETWDNAKEYKFELKGDSLSLTATDSYSPSYTDMKKK